MMIACNNVYLVKVTTTKKVLGPNLGQSGTNSGPKLGFWPFPQVGSFLFLEIEYNYSLK